MTSCSYGPLFEPDPPAHAQTLQGQGEPIRPFVIEPLGTMPTVMEAGSTLWIRLTLIGPAANLDLSAFLNTLSESLVQQGLGPDHVRFQTAGATMLPEDLHLAPLDLPVNSDHKSGNIDRLRIELTSPLFLRQEGRWLSTVTFSDLFRASLRTIGQMFATYDARLPADFAALKTSAGQVVSSHHTFGRFTQPRFSSRSEQGWDQQGIIGAGEFRKVPLALLPWLIWGGRWHVGSHRVAGAGGWRVVLE